MDLMRPQRLARRPPQDFGRDPAPDELPVARVAGEPARATAGWTPRQGVTRSS